MSKDDIGFDVQKEMKHLKMIVEKDDRLTITSRFVKYLIEQAERVQELQKEVKDQVGILDRSQERYNELITLSENKRKILKMKNKHYRETIEELLSSWKSISEDTITHNKSDYSTYRTGLIEGLEFAIDELENVLEVLK